MSQKTQDAVRALVERGVSDEEILRRFGPLAKRETLQNYIRAARPAPRGVSHVNSFDVGGTGLLLMVEEAARRNTTPALLCEQILQHVLADNLFAAVLDG